MGGCDSVKTIATANSSAYQQQCSFFFSVWCFTFLLTGKTGLTNRRLFCMSMICPPEKDKVTFETSTVTGKAADRHAFGPA
jgi:hypothetical protein